MELTAANVHEVFMKSLYTTEPSPEDAEKAIRVYGIMNNIGFNPDNLELQRDNIESMIMQLPLKFRLSKSDPTIELIFLAEFFKCISEELIDSDLLSKLHTILPGESFLYAYLTIDNVHWGEHRNMEELVILGIAIKKLRFVFPRSFWKHLHGSVPRIMILDSDELKHQQFMTSLDLYITNFEAKKNSELTV